MNNIKVFFPARVSEYNCNGESMWVKVLKQGENYLIGELDNHPVLRKDLKCGDIIKATKDSMSPHTRWQEVKKIPSESLTPNP